MINSLLAAEFFEPLCLTLLHSLWQVALLALIASACCRWLCRKNVYWKYTTQRGDLGCRSIGTTDHIHVGRVKFGRG